MPDAPLTLRDRLQRSYDELPYGMLTHWATHPSRLHVAGLLRGLHPSLPDRCRVLELGYAEGGNLVVLAELLRGASFVGIDLSATHVRLANERIVRLGLDNATVHHRDIVDLDGSLGSFDYVLAHGVFSWVPQEVQDHLLALCRDVLTPGGIALISYNTFPGWHAGLAVRRLLLDAVKGVEGTRERVVAARGLLAGLKSDIDATAPYGALLLDHVRTIEEGTDAYVAHDYLEAVNTPVTFTEFSSRCSRAGLQLLGDVVAAPGFGTVVDEQRLDDLGGTSFRASILCRDDEHLSAPDFRPALELWAQGKLTAVDPEPGGEWVSAFTDATGGRIATRSVPMAAVLTELGDRWPSATSVRTLVEAARRDTDDPDTDPLDAERAVCELLAGLHLQGGVDLSAVPYPVSRRLGPRPTVRASARLEATLGPGVTNQLHRRQNLDDVLCLLVRSMDGTRTVDELLEVVVDAAARGEVGLDEDGTLVIDRTRQRELLEEIVPRALGILVDLAMIVPADPT